MTMPPIDKTFPGTLKEWFSRLVTVERRLALGNLPARLQPEGEYITDWDAAENAGFYWTDVNNTGNGPPAAGTLAAGLVLRSDTRVIQEVWSLTTTTDIRVNTWRRVRSGTWQPWQEVGVGHNLGTVDAATNPPSFPMGLSFGNGPTGFPATNVIVETVKYAQTRIVQRVYEKGETTYRRHWYRTGQGDGTTWGAWVLASAEASAWVTISSSFLDATVTINRDGRTAMMRGSSNTDIAISTGLTDITSTAIPSDWRPSANSWGAAYSAGVSATALLRPDGTVAISNRNAIALTGTVFFSITYLLDS